LVAVFDFSGVIQTAKVAGRLEPSVKNQFSKIAMAVA
jgi:hypothetical protein